MIKVSHESPLALLDASRNYNDYDYALVHLFEEEPEYFVFFVESLNRGRKVLLDNSIFELGTAFNTEKYIKWINKLQPTEYIIPDVLENCDETIKSAKNWINSSMQYCVDFDCSTIGVVQGKNYGELVKCYTALDRMGIHKLAISFDYSYYREVFPHPNKWVSFMMGRVATLTRMLNDGVINVKKPHHLLGCAHPREFGFYATPEYNWIKTLDTSSPIVHGLYGITGKEYANAIGGWQKVSTKLVDLLHSKPDEKQIDAINSNISLFKSFIA